MAEKLELSAAVVDTVRAALNAQSTDLVPYGLDFELGVDPVSLAYQDEGSRIELRCVGAQGIRLRVALANPGGAARALIVQLNKTNLSTKSLLKRALERLQVLGAARYAGTIVGSPD